MTRQSSFLQYILFVGLFSIFILIGVIALNTAYPALAQPNLSTVSSAVQNSDTHKATAITDDTQPVNISSNKLNISIPIQIGRYDTIQKSWTLSSSVAYFLEGSSRLSTLHGQTILYAHNSPQLFGRLNELKKGDTVTIIDNLGQNFTYSLLFSRNIQPSDTSILFENTSSPRLVLLTCRGWFDEIREAQYFALKQD